MDVVPPPPPPRLGPPPNAVLVGILGLLLPGLGHVVAGRPGKGFFYAPTVLADVPADSRCLGEEIFGPVAPVCTFTDDADAVAKANGTECGLVGYIYTNDQNRMIRVAEAMEFGMIGVNTGIVSNPAAPFGGVILA